MKLNKIFVILLLLAITPARKKERAMRTSTVRWSLGLIMVLGLMAVNGCGQDIPSSSTAPSISLDRRSYIYDLAREYESGKPDTPENNRKRLDSIKSLKGAEARLFHKALDEFDTQEPVTEEEKFGKLFYQELVKLADSKGIVVISLSHEDVDKVFKETASRLYNSGEIKFPLSPVPTVKNTPTTTSFGGICPPPFSRCNYAYFDTYAKGGSCGSGAGCVSATGGDRTSNTDCEMICDHRVWFPTSKNTVAGKETKSQCVVDYYGDLPSRLGSGGYREVLTGASVPSSCHIYGDVTAFLQNNLTIF